MKKVIWKVRFRTRSGKSSITHEPGSVSELEDDVAEKWLTRGLCELLPEPVPEPAGPAGAGKAKP